MQTWIIVATTAVYLAALFAIASYGDRVARQPNAKIRSPLIYPLALAVYCTSWTFFGSVGLAASTGLGFLTIYIGPILMITLGYPLLQRVVTIAKAQNITSIADFIGARFGKSRMVAAMVTAIAIIGTVPYIALQLKAVSVSLITMLSEVRVAPELIDTPPVFGDISLLVTLTLAAFAILFGTRHIEATEHQDGLMLAIAVESIVKLAAFVAVGIFVTYVMFDGFGDLLRQASERTEIRSIFDRPPPVATWLTMCLLSFVCILLLPRQFHVSIVEANSKAELRHARWMFPAYLLIINLFVLPIAIAGLVTFGANGADADMFVLRLPIIAENQTIAIITFIGGLSAATAMVIVASVAVSIMISNELIMPIVLSSRGDATAPKETLRPQILKIRRLTILGILLLGYAYYRLSGDAALASIGLLSFAAIAQLAPAFFGGLFWRRGTARGAIAGMMIGITLWCYTLLIPTIAHASGMDGGFIENGLFGWSFLKPEALFGIDADPLVHGVLFSLLANGLAFAGFSLLKKPEPIERLQAAAFVPLTIAPGTSGLRDMRSSVPVSALRRAVAGYLGADRTDRALADFQTRNHVVLDLDADADLELLRYCEKLLASAVGAASSRLVLSLLLKRNNVSPKDALKLLDDASAALQHNRDLLQTALDQVGQGIAVFNTDLQLICWNRQFRGLLSLPPDLGAVGIPLNEILLHSAEQGEFGTGPVSDLVNERIEAIVVTMEPFVERLQESGIILEVRINPMPDGGLVLTYSDVTARTTAQEALAEANESLERRVSKRTEELTRLNVALGRAREAAEEADLSKTRFLAAAGHDVMQPLNAARLYTSSLLERTDGDGDQELARRIDASLESVEDILGALLDISKLDAGAMRPERSTFPLHTILDQMRTAFEPVARREGIDLRILPTSLYVNSDRRLLRRVLQNLVSNAIKYGNGGRVLVGVRRKGSKVKVGVYDTGPGIPLSKQALIFKEFQRLDQHRQEPGLGLGLSIVQRMCGVLEHPVDIASIPGRGSIFSVDVPLAQNIIQHSAAVSTSANENSRASLSGLRVLCIDNDEDILSGMQALLATWDCDVRVALGLPAAIEQMRQFSGYADIILADYHLDNDNGVDAVIALRKQFDVAIPAVLITADRTPAVSERATENSIWMLHKPLKPAALRAIMTQFASQRDAAE